MERGRQRRVDLITALLMPLDDNDLSVVERAAEALTIALREVRCVSGALRLPRLRRCEVHARLDSLERGRELSATRGGAG